MTVTMFALGGTISMAGGRGGVVARLTGADLIAAIPELAEAEIPLDVVDVEAVPSANLTFAGVLAVVAAAEQAVRRGAAGVVVTQGTDTLEETAYLVDLVWPHDAPFVLTGAMRNPTLAGPDGPANLLAAIRVAADPAATGLGALVVLADEIHAARHVRKTHATSPAAFASPDTGAIGHVVEGEVRVLTRVPRSAPLPVPDPGALDRCVVPLYTVTFDDDGRLLRPLLDETGPPTTGLVVAAFGVGHVPARLAPILGDLAARMPVVLTSRTGTGSVLRHTYGSVGSEADLQRRGLINGGYRHPYQARILLRLLRASGADPARIRAAFSC
jgi:L-asparaginase